MKPHVPRLLVLLAVLLGVTPAALATTIVPLRFDEVVERSGVIVEGTVTDIQVWPTGAELPPAPADPVPGSPTAPVSAGVEGGRMLFTEITMSVDRQVGGSPAPEVRFTLAGGSSGGETFVIFGMPRFEVGQKYIVMLRPDYRNTNVPVVGVSQGFFQITRDPSNGGEMLLTADGDIVLGIEDGRVALRHNPARADHRTPHLAPPPVPGEGSAVQPRTSPRVERYWTSTETPVAPGDFFDTVRSMKEAQP